MIRFRASKGIIIVIIIKDPCSPHEDTQAEQRYSSTFLTWHYTNVNCKPHMLYPKDITPVPVEEKAKRAPGSVCTNICPCRE